MNFVKSHLTQSTPGQSQLYCPSCGDDYIHLIKIEPNSTEEGKLTVNLKFLCKEGHEFEYFIHNKNGFTFSEETLTKN